MSKRVLKSAISDYGTIGEETKVLGIFVGDVVAFVCEGSLRTGVVCKKGNFYSVMGSMSRELGKLGNGISQIRVVLRHNSLTDDVLLGLENGDFLRIEEAKSMTLKEIEKALGYPVNIVEEVK